MIPNSTHLTLPNKLKLTFVGDQKSGKTSLINRIVLQQFNPDEQTTIGVDFMVKSLLCCGVVYRVQFWDTGGQERFRPLIRSYLRDALCVVVVFDLTDPGYKEKIDYWIREVRGILSQQTPIILCGNKCDLIKQPMPALQIPMLQPTSTSTSSSTTPTFPSIFTSAKQDININELTTLVMQKTVEYHNRCKDAWNNRPGN